MRRFVYICGILLLVLVVAGGIAIRVVAYKGNALDRESKAFVDAAIPAIAANWRREQLLERATPELRDNAKPEDLRRLFDALSRLGALLEYEGATGEALMSYVAGSGSTVSATYTAKARFQNGGASFRVVLLKRDDRWMIHNFHVDPLPGAKASGGA